MPKEIHRERMWNERKWFLQKIISLMLNYYIKIQTLISKFWGANYLDFTNSINKNNLIDIAELYFLSQ